MDERQKRGAAVLSLLIVGLATAFLAWLAIEVIFSTHPLGDNFPGREFMLVIHNWTVLGVATKAIFPIVTLGITWFGAYKLKDWQYYGTLATSALGAAAALYMLFEVSSVTTAQRFWAYSPVTNLEDYDSLVLAAQIGLGATAAWLGVLLALQVGVKGGAS